MALAIEIDHVSKRFRINLERHQSLKERAIHLGRRRKGEPFWALRDVAFDVAEGETLGLLGHNGSGKSTLLKCIGGILQPSEGLIRTRGRLASLLELGAGFHPDLTGRENIYLNASILGLSRRDIDRRFDDIVGFSELEHFIDHQVKHYSSGMYVRLGFAVAINVDPDILLVDEVLAVGDEAFQRKCLDRVRVFQREGRTIVVVTHGADLVRQVCDRAAVLDHGRLVTLGTPGEAVRSFREHLLAGQPFGADGADDGVGTPQERKRNLKVRITDVALEYPGSDQRPYLLPDDPLAIRVSYEAIERVDEVVFGLAVYGADGHVLFGSNTGLLGERVGPVEGPGQVVFNFEHVPLLDGTYPVTLAIHSPDEGIVYDWSDQKHHFEVMNPGRAVGVVSLPLFVTVDPGPVPEETRS